MKKASTLISVIIAVVVLLAALGVGFSIKQFRVHRAEKAAQAEPAPQVEKPIVSSALPGRGDRRPSGELSPDQRTERQEDREQEIERVNNMSEDERREYMRKRSERFGTGGRREGREGMGGGRRPGGFGGMSEEERQAMKERIENMTEEERRQYFEQMRERFGGGRRRGDRGAGPGGAPDGSFRRRGDGEGMREPRPDGPREN